VKSFGAVRHVFSQEKMSKSHFLIEKLWGMHQCICCIVGQFSVQ